MESRSEAGHWEGDLIVGKNQGSAIGTLVERQTRLVRLLRDYFPKGTDLTAHTAEHLLAVENELNTRPRIVLNDRPPQELFDALIAC